MELDHEPGDQPTGVGKSPYRGAVAVSGIVSSLLLWNTLVRSVVSSDDFNTHISKYEAHEQENRRAHRDYEREMSKLINDELSRDGGRFTQHEGDALRVYIDAENARTEKELERLRKLIEECRNNHGSR